MQYANSEGLMPLREWIAQRVSLPQWPVRPEQVLVTTGSQQGLDLLGKVLMDPGCKVQVDMSKRLVTVQSAEDRLTLAEALTEAGYPPS